MDRPASFVARALEGPGADPDAAALRDRCATGG